MIKIEVERFEKDVVCKKEKKQIAGVWVNRDRIAATEKPLDKTTKQCAAAIELQLKLIFHSFNVYGTRCHKSRVSPFQLR